MTRRLLKRIPSSKPAITSRQASCTHVTVTRVFDTDGSLKCDNCKKSPDLGWVYACTEDRDWDSRGEKYPGSLLRFSFPTENPPSMDVSLSGWIVKAIEEGHYTEEQAKAIKLQRLKVLETMQITRNPKHENSTGSRSPTQAPEEFKDKASGSIGKRITAAIMPLHSNKQDTTPIPICHLRQCHHCFPVGYDRSWLSLNEVCSESYPEKILLPDVLNRPVVSISHIHRLGPGSSETLHSASDDRVVPPSTSNISISTNTPESQKIGAHHNRGIHPEREITPEPPGNLESSVTFHLHCEGLASIGDENRGDWQALTCDTRTPDMNINGFSYENMAPTAVRSKLAELPVCSWHLENDNIRDDGDGAQAEDRVESGSRNITIQV